MRMLIVVPILGGLIESKPYWGCLLNSIQGPVDLMVIDNGNNVDEGQLHFFREFIQPHWPGQFTYAPQDDNLGMILSMQYGYENSEHDILCYLHNDLYIYDYGWDQNVIGTFETAEDIGMGPIGLAGFFGAERVDRDGTRGYVYSNMLEAEIHGGREVGEIKEISVLDGMSIIASRSMLDIRHGFDLNYDIHHFYDLDISLESIDRGFRNFYLPVAIHHQSGVTACKPTFQDWANRYMGMERDGERAIYLKNRALFEKKWFDKLPFWVNHDQWQK